MTCMADFALSCLKINNMEFVYTVRKETEIVKLKELVIEFSFKDGSYLLVKYINGEMVRYDVRRGGNSIR